MAKIPTKYAQFFMRQDFSDRRLKRRQIRKELRYAIELNRHEFAHRLRSEIQEKVELSYLALEGVLAEFFTITTEQVAQLTRFQTATEETKQQLAALVTAHQPQNNPLNMERNNG